MGQWPIVIVTGANSGLGFGICHRLLIQLSQKTPPDSLVNLGGTAHNEYGRCDGLTLIMACRNLKLAEAARTKLNTLVDAHIARLKTRSEYGDHAEKFRRNLTIDICYIDLALVSSVLKFANMVSQNYPYISHIFCNAGVASWDRIDWIAFVEQFCTEPVNTFCSPKFNIQHSGERSVDGLGWVWQCNVFGHYVLYRSIQAKLICSPMTPRVIWMSSHGASSVFGDADDWQLLRTGRSYEASKYQIELLAVQLDQQCKSRTRHVVVQPGCVLTNIVNALVGGALYYLMLTSFYIVRLLGSKMHTIRPYTGAGSAIQAALVSLPHILKSPETPVKYTSGSGRWGKEQTTLEPIDKWKENEGRALQLARQCEDLYQEFLEKQE